MAVAQDLNFFSLSQLSSQEMVRGMPKLKKISDSCTPCINSKEPRRSFPSTAAYRAARALESIYTDLCRPLEPESLGKGQFFLLILDDFSRLT